MLRSGSCRTCKDDLDRTAMVELHLEMAEGRQLCFKFRSGRSVWMKIHWGSRRKSEGKVEAEEGTGDVTVQYGTGKGRAEEGRYGNFCN